MFYLAGGQTESYKVISATVPEYLQVGNILKIGRMKYAIKSSFNGKKLKKNKNQKDKIGGSEIKNFKKCTGTCKFCLS